MKLKDWMLKYKVTARQMEDDLMYGRDYLYKVIGEKMAPGRKLATIISEYTEGEVTIAELGYKEKVRCVCPTCGRLR